MKAITLGLIAVTAAALTGCLVTSVYPFYQEKDLVFEPALAGHWTKTDDANEHWSFAKEGANAYQLTYISGSKTNLIQARLFKLEGQMFLDLFAGEGEWETTPPPIPSHLLLHVLQLTPNVRMTALDNDWLAGLLKKSPNAIRHELLKIGDKPEDVRVVLTADTTELQRFVLSHLKDDKAWTEPLELKKD